ncbi:SDR family oxidoreductase [Aspergillus alliaceus]|uniref:SDR family oxidoreductase n=1 Tax=Petromyces alliaceus TaxID=209559 RepID=UPI0012A4C024|nr:NAD(P)-binding protein [Aspergillus alliaceus]KAB8231434.1 NAD(P)-binding protein [Aspergillus alliaceus]
MPPAKTILISGCSAHGIGSALALTLAQKGHHIYATARNPSKILGSLTSLPNVTPLQLDVTSTTSVSEAVKAIEDRGLGLDVLVNNAGSGYTMPLLDADLEMAQQVYDTNVWGALRMIQGFADLLVASGGRVVNVSTVGAVVNTPWIGIYSSSKSSLTTLSETLRLELAPLGVSVLAIMVGTVTTTFHANEPEVILPPTSRYTAIRDTISRWATGQAGPKGCSVTEFAESIADDVLGEKGVVWRGPYSAAMRFLSRWCPGWLLDQMMSSGQGLDQLAKR